MSLRASPNNPNLCRDARAVAAFGDNWLSWWLMFVQAFWSLVKARQRVNLGCEEDRSRGRGVASPRAIKSMSSVALASALLKVA